MKNFKKENLVKLPVKYFLSSVIILMTAILLFAVSNFLKGTWLTVLLVAYLVNITTAALLVFSGIFLLFYLRKHEVERKKIRWGIYINFLTILIFFVSGLFYTLD